MNVDQLSRKQLIAELESLRESLGKYESICQSTGEGILIAETERRLARDGVQESGQLSQAVIDNSPLGIAIRNRYGKLLSVNRAWRSIWQVSDEFLREKMEAEPYELKFDAGDSYLGDWQPKVTALFRDGGQLHIPELRLDKRLALAPRCVSLTFYAIHDDNGDVAQVVIITNDITERKQAEDSLKKQQSLLQDIIEGTDDAVFVKDLDGVYLAVNTAEAVSCDRPADQIIGITDEELFRKDVSDRSRAQDRHVIETGKQISYEQVFPHADGMSRIWHIVKFPKRGAKGQIEGVVGIARDITERKRMEKALETSELSYRSTVENLLIGVVVHNSDSSILLCNPEAARILGLSIEQMKGKMASDPAWCFVNEDSSVMALVDYPVNIVLATRKPLKGYITGVRHPDRTHVTWLNVSATPIFSRDDEIEKIVTNFIDITETRRLQALESRASRLEMAGTIAGQVAHDFNNLLGPILGYPELIHDILPQDHKAHAYLDSIESAARKIASINQDLLTMGRRGHYSQTVVDLNRIVLQAAQELEASTETVVVELDLCKKLNKIMGGSAQIHRILSNLLMNAQDAVDDIGQITCKTENFYAGDTLIAFGRIPRGEYVRLTITDNGCGIPDDIIQNIFDPFFSTKTSDRQRGSGLGLSVVDSVMKDHAGHLDCTSNVGQGTSFYLYFPVTHENSGETELELPKGGTEKVLVVDDDEIQREVSSQLLAKLGYKNHTVRSGEEAIRFIQDNPQDLVILDMVMPGGMDGAETYRRLIEHCPGQKAILLSGFSPSERVMDAQKLGAGPFVRKPVTRTILAMAVRRELDRD
jgi:two-component system, cell cycle sensor histidine kinase and response regulator CckA